MKKILFFPLLRMQSGHHQVADAIMDMIKNRIDDIELKKIDLMSYTNKSLEKIISRSYLKWIRFAPATYNVVYKKHFYSQKQTKNSYKIYQGIFIKKMEQLIDEEKPDAIVCTHGFPSYLLSQLKMQGKCNVPVINVYTDFFINNVWAKEGIDFHFVPSLEVKRNLMEVYKIPSEKIIVTGIPTHEEILKTTHRNFTREKPQILVAGGNSGLGGILKLSSEMKNSKQFNFTVLCGNNQKLYDEILSWDLDHINPLPYISSRTEMNQIYDEVDAIITKPGGVTISEVLKKRLPIFVHAYLPGQEEINMTYLKKQQLVFELNQTVSLESQLNKILKDTRKMKQWEQSIDLFQKGLQLETPEQMVDVVNWILDKKSTSIPLYKVEPSIHLQVARV
ncbi:MGDG synthase family glycosyltransferase [Rummeliibacillus pycnus]|uniref:MGDG synthase family glycosyltransferase n=1 Tax=Rummeliibacillus pycnus TaxID=101070 RepID=UPI000C9B5B76|nr:glycosyltransferase [Rummeliibacillus pycnus]